MTVNLQNVSGMQLQSGFEFLKGVVSKVPHPARNERPLRLGVRQDVRLQTMFHLQAMLESAEEHVRGGKVRAFLIRSSRVVR